jgi:hypothetical protein
VVRLSGVARPEALDAHGTVVLRAPTAPLDTYQHIRNGVIPAERIGRRWPAPRKRFHDWLDGRREVA